MKFDLNELTEEEQDIFEDTFYKINQFQKHVPLPWSSPWDSGFKELDSIEAASIEEACKIFCNDNKSDIIYFYKLGLDLMGRIRNGT